MIFESWKRQVDVLMKAKYAIDSSDAGFDDDELQGHAFSTPKPADFVSWFAEKYGLLPIKFRGDTNFIP